MAVLYDCAMQFGNHIAPGISVSPEGEFDVVLRPYRSLGPRGFIVLMAVVVMISFIAGMVFWAMGAWPIAGFFGLDAALIYLAFKVSYGGALAQERIFLKHGKLVVRKKDARGRERQWSFEPYWVRLKLETGPAGDNRLMLTSHGRGLTIAGCLSHDERAAFAVALRTALAGAQHNAAPTLAN